MINIYCGVHKRLKLVIVRSQMNRISTTASCFSVSTKYFNDDQTEEYEVAGQVDAWERRQAYRVLMGNLKERYLLQRLQDSVLSKLIIKKWSGGCGMLLSSQERDLWCSVVNTGRMFFKIFISWPTYQLSAFEGDCAAWSLLVYL
jgi:hypothetical protein